MLWAGAVNFCFSFLVWWFRLIWSNIVLLFGPKALISFNKRAEHHHHHDNYKKRYHLNFIIYCLGFFLAFILFVLFLTMFNKKKGNYGERLPPLPLILPAQIICPDRPWENELRTCTQFFPWETPWLANERMIAVAQCLDVQNL